VPPAPQQPTPPPAPPALPPLQPVPQATKEVAMIVPADVKADRKIEFIVDDVKYSAVLPEGLAAGETFRARIPVAPIITPALGPTVGGELKRPAEEKTGKPSAKKSKKSSSSKKREMKSDNEEEEDDDENAGQDEIPQEERISARVRERRSSRVPADDPASKAWGEHVTPGGIRYWYNTITGMTSWDKPRGWVSGQKPQAPAPAAAPAPVPAPAPTGSGKEEEELMAALGN